jgi:hypothetical protein
MLIVDDASRGRSDRREADASRSAAPLPHAIQDALGFIPPDHRSRTLRRRHGQFTPLGFCSPPVPTFGGVRGAITRSIRLER